MFYIKFSLSIISITPVCRLNGMTIISILNGYIIGLEDWHYTIFLALVRLRAFELFWRRFGCGCLLVLSGLRVGKAFFVRLCASVCVCVCLRVASCNLQVARVRE